jgi:hypothetical protein
MPQSQEIGTSIIYSKKQEFETMRHAVARGINIKLFCTGKYNYLNNRYEVIVKLSNQNMPEDPSEAAAINQMFEEMRADMTAFLKQINNEETVGDPDSIPFEEYQDEPRNKVKKSKTVVMDGKRTSQKGVGWEAEINKQHEEQAAGEGAMDNEGGEGGALVYGI